MYLDKIRKYTIPVLYELYRYYLNYNIIIIFYHLIIHIVIIIFSCNIQICKYYVKL